MEIKRRRWWTWALSTAAALVVLAATLSLLFRLAVDAVPGYREKLQSLVTQAAGHPTRIGSMALTWQRLRPSLDLRDVALLDDQGQPLLHLARLRLGFGLRRLLKADWTPGAIEIYGLELEADVDALGRWSMRGFSGGAGHQLSDEEIRRIASLDRVRLRDCRLLLHDPQVDRQVIIVGIDDVEVRRMEQRFMLTARLQPPPQLAATATATATVSGDPARPDSLQGSWNLLLADIHGWPWLAGSLGSGVQLNMQQAQLRLSGRIESGRIAEVDASASAAAVAAQHGKDTLAQVTQLQLELAAWPEPDAWRTDIRKLALVGARGLAEAQGHFHYAMTAQGIQLDAGADGLRLDDLAPWLALWKGLPPDAARLRDLRGDVHDLALHYETAATAQPGAAAAPGRYSVQVRLQGAGLAADPAQPGFSGLDGTVEADQDGGHLHLRQTALVLQLPKAFQQPVPVTALSGDFGWKRNDPGTAAGWRIDAPQFDWKALGSEGHGQISLLLPSQAEAAPTLQLSADFAAEDPVLMKPWMPNDWGAGTRAWLNRALLHGHLPQGHLEIDGSLADFPFVDKPSGHWLLDLSVADGVLSYAPGWPQAEKLQAQLHFHGRSLQISSSGAQVAGNTVDHIEAQIPDFHEGHLTVDGSTAGEASRYYALLRDSPISHKLENLLSTTDPAGPLAADLHLEMLLNQDNPPVYVSGKVRPEGGSLKVRGIDPPVRALHGSLAFDDHGITSDGLSGELYGVTLSATIHPEAESPEGVVLVQTDAPVQAADGLLATYLPDWLLQRLSGTAHLAARLPLEGPRAGEITLSSDLRGVAVRMPQPLTKAAADSMPLSVTVSDGTAGAADALLVSIDAGDRLGAALRFVRPAKPANADLLTRGVEIRVGPGNMPRAEGDGILVRGAPAQMDVAAWIELLGAVAPGDGSTSTGPSAAHVDSTGLALRGFDLTPQQVVYGGATLLQPHLVGSPRPDGWSVRLDGANAQGSIDYSRAGGGRVIARLQKLQLQALAPPAQPADAAAASAPFDPVQAPLLDLACDSLKIGAADLGRLNLLTSRIAGGQSLDQFKLEGGILQTNTRGTWLRRNGSSYADLSFEFNSSDLGTVLQALGYADTMDAKRSTFSGTLSWPQSPDGLDLAQARGTLSLAVEKGTLRSIDQRGAGRVLGLLNLYALPRRLTFDFHDVVSKGLGFDKLSGSFKLADGQAQSDDLQLVSPAMKMEISGRIGLAARDYDQKITVHPDLATEVIVGATLVNPIAGGVALLAEEVFNKPFNKLSQFSYHVTGSWDNPQVNGAETKDAPKANAPPPAAPVPAVSPPPDAG